MAKPKKLPKRLSNKLVKLTTSATPVISTPKTYQEACLILRNLQTLRKTIISHYTPIKDAINSTRKTILDLEKADLGKIQPAEASVMAAIIAYEDGAPEALDVAAPIGQYRFCTVRVVVDDMQKFVDGVARGDVSLNAVRPHNPTLNKLARQRGDLFAVAGCHVEKDLAVVTRAE